MRWLPAAVAAAGCATATPAPVELAGRALAPPVSCIDRGDVGRVETMADGRVAMFHMRGGDIFRNDLPGACPRLGRDSIVHDSSVDRYCRNDVVRLVDLTRGFETGVCTLGAFTPWQAAAG
jgi:hypothetical protein